MTSWDEAIESTTADFIERLEQRGFVWDGERLTGSMPGDPAPVPVGIELSPNLRWLLAGATQDADVGDDGG